MITSTPTSELKHFHLFYVRPESFSRFISGCEVPSVRTLNDSHVFVGAAEASDLEHLFARMNLFEEDGLRRLFRRNAGTHTSMSVGDVARLEENGRYRYWVCRPMGWEEIS